MTGTFMAAEIAETGQALRRQLDANRDATKKLAAELRAAEPAFVATVARGSSDHAALFIKYAIELKIGLACASLHPSIASLYHAPLKLSRGVALTISQSGKSPDIIAMQKAAKAAGATTIALVNDPEFAGGHRRGRAAALARRRGALGRRDQVDDRLPLRRRFARGGMERRRRSRLRAGKTAGAPRGRSDRPPESPIQSLIAAKSLFVLGRGSTFAIAMEAALKLKETSAIHAEAFSSAEVLHGPAGVITRGFLLLCFAPVDAARPEFFKTIDRLASFGATPLIIDVERHPRWLTILTPDAGHPIVTPIAALHAFYMLAEQTARRRGRNPDLPPHLQKVTRTV